jgi:hypothetical protein
MWKNRENQRKNEREIQQNIRKPDLKKKKTIYLANGLGSTYSTRGARIIHLRPYSVEVFLRGSRVFYLDQLNNTP